MKKYFNKFFNTNNEGKINEIPLTDSFADSLSLDLKRSANEAILTALRKNQEKYLSSILKQSYFPIESLVFHPLDNNTALQTEEFFRIHSEIDLEFESNFFANLMLKEYRTELGSCARPAEGLTPSIQPNIASMDNPTSDESYQITLRGNKKRFSAEVKLGVLKSHILQTSTKAEVKPPATIPSSHKTQTQATQENSVAQRNANQELQSEANITVHVRDANGEHHYNIQTPCIIGRETTENSDSHLEKINVQGMYISRHQLTIFQLNGIPYLFVPKEASLTGVLGRRGILQKMHLLEVDNIGLTITLGQPVDSMQTSVDPSNPSLYPTLQIKRVDHFHNLHESTPIPKVKK